MEVKKPKVAFPFVAREVEGMNCLQKCVLMHLAAYANAKGECWPSIETLVRKTGACRRSVIKAIAGLKESGVVTYERGGSKTGKANHYKLHLQAMKAKAPGHHVHPDEVDQGTTCTQLSDTRASGAPDQGTTCTQTRASGAPQVSIEVSKEVSTNIKTEVSNKIKNEVADLNVVFGGLEADTGFAWTGSEPQIIPSHPPANPTGVALRGAA